MPISPKRRQELGPTVQAIHGDCRDILPTLPDASIDAVITDPPYPCIKRSYGYWTESEWMDLMDVVVPQCRRVLKPTGSAVFILQPNSERLGRMRTWLWDFLAKWGREWGVVQDAYWWNVKAIPEAHASQGRLMRPSLKYAVWFGSPDCWRDQDAVLWGESEQTRTRRVTLRSTKRRNNPSGHGFIPSHVSETIDRRGGVTPYNVLPMPTDRSQVGAGIHGHGAGTPLPLLRWWSRYICPPGGTILDPFAGSGTLGLAALRERRSAILIEKETSYIEIINKRLEAERAHKS